MVQAACRQSRRYLQQHVGVTKDGWGEVTAARRIRAKAASDLLKRVADNGRAARLLGLHRSTFSPVRSSGRQNFRASNQNGSARPVLWTLSPPSTSSLLLTAYSEGLRETVGWDYYGVFSQWDRCLRDASAIGISRSEVTAGSVVGSCPSRWAMMKERRDFRPTKVTLDICSFTVPARAVAAE